MASETKAERIERIKREKDGLEVISDIYRYAQTGEAIDPEDIDRFKWYGIYTQNRNLQEAEDETQYLMLRVKLDGGYISAKQAEVLGDISVQFARESGDITTRQDIQFHWLKIEDLPELLERLSAVGLSVVGASGDCPRNIVSCPVNGIDHDQIDDVRDVVVALNNLYRGNPDFSNLPRKFKIGVSGCNKHCIQHEVQDLAFTAVKEGDEIRFSVSVGGGQASNRRIADHIGYVKRRDIVKIAEAVARIYRDSGRRDNRNKARLGHLVEDWGVERFVAELEKESRVELERYDGAPFTPYPRRSHFGVGASVKKGYNTIGCALTSGRIKGENLLKLGRILDLYKAEGITLTTTQNFVILNVHTDATEPMIDTLKAVGFHPYPSVFEARTLACTGLNFCKFAVSETKDLAIEVVEYLTHRFPDFYEPVSISINGCPNSCAHPHIVDLGFVGAIVKRGDERLKGFDLIVGGHLEGEQSRFALKTGVKVAADEVAPLIESLIHNFEASNSTDFGNFLWEKYAHESAIPSTS
ncbi:MAG: ferredoxin--nitrite reductase [Sulfuricurvum sp. GWF2_44_89]|uniref:Ferredoxin--nitrite reductase n=1 Tax=Sulfuricurvum kujiense TaxID=148813 RepID=A0A2D3WEA6_9BACT|nr:MULTISPECIES: nitrite/sulfite reductase [Sulfuricurvum]OHD79323.1 MAG: ferredoxin--nitrite reductase [Sulfuricurvum sp. GWF2_44_89]OHD91336.1 MAG: ferredoxin--nitrite reductase [Sulfuricurvum sp. RIFOXYD2_FULL_44_160]OHD92795.1 MAG: ferredoxin--nitrite reductase [Sulfuricurvum sp. RIFOXYD12_FULL_44_77]DAB38225.1 MAG TPA: ferredoxin--nitrite reductase [Sulfuricurvum kujiense]